MTNSFPWAKVINDPIHGHIKVDPVAMDFIDTPEFQRLRDLKQLGAVYYVFPGASHNRFEHSVGVYHLASQLVNRFRAEQPELDIDESDVKCVGLAGLCHDLGHGPFSHTFDHVFIKKVRPDIQWTHEVASEMMLEQIVSGDNGIDHVDTSEMKFIKSLIQGESKPGETHRRREKQFLFDIVANKRNSIDVDKFDYIKRDSFNIGTSSSFALDRLMNLSRVVENQICYSFKDTFNIYELFHTRYSLFKRVYTHKVVKAVELMIVDALVAADPHLNISSMIDDPERYVTLNDTIIGEIERSKLPELAESRSVIQRIRRRQLYRCVDEVIEPPGFRAALRDEVNIQNILAHQPAGAGLRESDIYLDMGSLNFSMKDRNPVDNVKFYGKYKPDEPFHIRKDNVSLLIPDNYEENVLRIFARDENKMKSIQTAFRKWVDQINVELRGRSVIEDDSDRLSLGYERGDSQRDRSWSPQRNSGRFSYGYGYGSGPGYGSASTSTTPSPSKSATSIYAAIQSRSPSLPPLPDCGRIAAEPSGSQTPVRGLTPSQGKTLPQNFAPSPKKRKHSEFM